MPLSPQRKKEIEDEETKKFAAKKETEDEAAYRAKVRANLESGGMTGFIKKKGMSFLKDAAKNL